MSGRFPASELAETCGQTAAGPERWSSWKPSSWWCPEETLRNEGRKRKAMRQNLLIRAIWSFSGTVMWFWRPLESRDSQSFALLIFPSEETKCTEARPQTRPVHTDTHRWEKPDPDARGGRRTPCRNKVANRMLTWELVLRGRLLKHSFASPMKKIKTVFISLSASSKWKLAPSLKEYQSTLWTTDAVTS